MFSAAPSAAGQAIGIFQVHPQLFAPFAAGRILSSTFDAFETAPQPCLVLATGRTMEPVFDAIVAQEDGRLRGAWLTHLDEYAFPTRIFPEKYDAVSFSSALRRGIFEPALGKSPDGWPNVHMIDPYGKPKEEAQRHTDFLRNAGGITTAVVGIGRGPAMSDYAAASLLKRLFHEYASGTGSSFMRRLAVRAMPSIHLAFAEADAKENRGVFTETAEAYFMEFMRGVSANVFLHGGSLPFRVDSYIADLHPATIKANGLAPLGIDHAITMSLGAILCADRIICIAKGKEKALPLLLALIGPVTPLVPASALQLVAQKVTVIADEDALGLIPPWHGRHYIGYEDPA